MIPEIKSAESDAPEPIKEQYKEDFDDVEVATGFSGANAALERIK
jgi:hypothetical protein